jgi:hypothetical protein
MIDASVIGARGEARRKIAVQYGVLHGIRAEPGTK